MKDILFPDGKIEDFQGLSTDETLELFEIDSLQTAKKYDEALGKIRTNISNPNYSFLLKQRLKHSAAKILWKQNKIYDSLKYCDEIIEDSKFNPKEYFFKNKFLRKHEDKIKNFRECLKKHQYYWRAYEQIVQLEVELLSRKFKDSEGLILELEKDFDSGIKCYPCIENDCFSEKFSYLLSNRNSYTQNWFKDAKEIYEMAKSQNPDHPICYDYKRRLIICDPSKMRNKQQETEELTVLWNELFAKLDDNFDAYIAQCLLLLDTHIIDSNKISQIQQKIESNEFRLQRNMRYVKIFADFYARRCGYITKALELWGNIPEDDYTLPILRNLNRYYALLDRKMEFQQLLQRIKDNSTSRISLELELLLAESRQDFDHVLSLIDKLKIEEAYENEFFTEKMYALLCKNEFETVYNETKSMLQKNTETCDRMHCDIINYEIARDKKGARVRKDKLEEIISTATTEIKIAAYLLLGKNKEANSLVEEDIRFDYISLYEYKNTYVFKTYLDETIKKKIEKNLDQIK